MVIIINNDNSKAFNTIIFLLFYIPTEIPQFHALGCDRNSVGQTLHSPDALEHYFALDIATLV